MFDKNIFLCLHYLNVSEKKKSVNTCKKVNI